MARRRDDDDDDDELPKKKSKLSRPVEDDEDDDDFDDEPRPKKKSKENAYTGLLIIAFLALVTGAVFFYLDTDEQSKQALSAPNWNVPGLGLAGQPAGQ